MNFSKSLEQDQEVELLVAKDKKYNFKCRNGNWPHEELVEKEKLRDFLKKRERGELLIQKTARLFDKFLAPIQQQTTSGMVEKTYVAFDQIFQLIACDMPTIHSTAPSLEPLTLSAVVNEPHINTCQEIDQHCGLSCAPSSKLIARNAFVIRRPLLPKQQQSYNFDENATTANTKNNGEYLKYGQDFMLECYESQHKPLLVYSMPKNPFAACHDNVFKAHGEMKQFVGLALHRRGGGDGGANNNGDKFACTMESIPSAFFLWRLYHVDPEMRYETIGENVKINAKVIVEHRSTRNNLCCEKVLLSTIFGMECGVSCHTERNIYGKEADSNIWRISTKSSEI